MEDRGKETICVKMQKVKTVGKKHTGGDRKVKIRYGRERHQVKVEEIEKKWRSVEAAREKGKGYLKNIWRQMYGRKGSGEVA